MFTQLLITQLQIYHDKCIAWFRSLVTRTEEDGRVKLKPAAAALEGGDLSATVDSIWRDDGSDRSRLLQTEVDMILESVQEKPLDPFDIISDRRTGTSLCLLYSSMQWLAMQLDGLRSVEKKSVQSTPAPQDGQRTNRWTMISTVALRDTDQPIFLPMTDENRA